MHDSNVDQAQRLHGIDALRGLAVLLMVEQHLGIWLWKEYYALYKHPFMLCFNGLGGFAAPLFITLAGLGCTLVPRRHRHTGRTLIVRGAGVLCCGYLLNLLIPSWFSPGSWYVLHLIGACLTLAPLLLKVPSYGMIGLIAGILLATAGVQNALDTPLAINNSRMGTTALPGGVFRLILAEGHFPLLPWTAFFCAGILAGRWGCRKDLRSAWVLSAVMSASGIALGACAALGFSWAHTEPLLRVCRLMPRFYPALMPITLLLMGPALLAATACSHQGFTNLRGFFSPLVCLGRSSLTILMVHAVLFRQVSRYAGLWRSFTLGETLFLTGAVLVLFALLAMLWEKANYAYGAEWLLRKTAG